MRLRQISIRSLMTLTAVAGIDMAAMAQISKRGGAASDDRSFFAVALVILNALVMGYMIIVSRIARTPEESQSRLLLSMGCALFLMLILSVPVLLMLCSQ